MQSPPGQEGVSDLLDGLFSYGTQTLDRSAFRKALDDIAANENAGYSFSVRVLKDNFSRGVQLLADNELHPALPAKAFPVVQTANSEFVAGNLKSPEYRTSRALDLAFLPAGDPALREVTPATLARVGARSSEAIFAATIRPDLTTIVVIGDISPEEAKTVIEKWFGDWKAVGPKPEVTLPAVPEQTFGSECPRSGSRTGFRGALPRNLISIASTLITTRCNWAIMCWAVAFTRPASITIFARRRVCL